VQAKVLGDDGANYAFQVAEIKAGYDPDLEKSEYVPNSAQPSTALAGWPASNTYDGNASTSWSSSLHGGNTNTEWLGYWWPQGKKNINYVKVLPRYSGSNALGFPKSFTIYFSNGSQWVYAVSHANYPTPKRGDWIVLPLPTTVLADGILIVATVLGLDDVGNYVLQFAEVTAGYDPRFNQFTYLGNNGASLRVETQNVGSEALDRVDQIGNCVDAQNNPTYNCSNWHYDDRGVILAANPGVNQNIYSPSIIYMGGTTWNTYFHGWDGTSDGHDRIYLAKTFDNFMNFGNHTLAVDNGVWNLVGNETVVKVSNTDWRMAFTALPGSNSCVMDSDCASGHCDSGNCRIYNRPEYGLSPDGTYWTPNAGDTAHLLPAVQGYPHDWSIADINGCNVIYFDGTQWHFFFQDDSTVTKDYRIQHATSYEGIGWNSFTWKDVSNPGHVLSDFRSISYSGSGPITTFYIGTYREDIDTVWMTMHTDTSAPPTTCCDAQNFCPPINGDQIGCLPSIREAFKNEGTNPDKVIVEAGLVHDGSRIYGVLYGADPHPYGDPRWKLDNEIYARWLQKRVYFSNYYVGWGGIENSYGPDIVRFYMPADNNHNSNIETGLFNVYDTDGTSLLLGSPSTTIRQGDVYRYNVPVVPVSAMASSTYSGTSPLNVIDSNLSTGWNAGSFPTSWIEFDLGSSVPVAKIRLHTAQSPAGSTTHTVYIGATPNPSNAVATLTGYTYDSQWLTVDLTSSPTTGRYIRVQTTASPSWVAWHEIEVYR